MSKVSTKYGTDHAWLRNHYPYSGVCDDCGETKRTTYAMKVQGESTKNREDYCTMLVMSRSTAKQRAALLEYAKQPKSLETRAKMSAAHKKARHASA